jgi:hypothetical protein
VYIQNTFSDQFIPCITQADKDSGDEQKILRAKGMAASYNGEALRGRRAENSSR